MHIKLKTAMYAALGYATFKLGKLYTKRRGKQAIRNWASS
jgi:hypothetical protein